MKGAELDGGPGRKKGVKMEKEGKIAERRVTNKTEVEKGCDEWYNCIRIKERRKMDGR